MEVKKKTSNKELTTLLNKLLAEVGVLDVEIKGKQKESQLRKIIKSIIFI